MTNRKPTEEEMKDLSKWVAGRNPESAGLYAVKLDTSGPYWLAYGNGNWAHGTHISYDDAEERTLGNFNRHDFLSMGDGREPNWFDFDGVPGLFD